MNLAEFQALIEVKNIYHEEYHEAGASLKGEALPGEKPGETDARLAQMDGPHKRTIQ